MDRETIINKYNKNEFMYFLEHDTNGSILELLNEEGLKILDDCRLREERITYILAYSKYKNELLSEIKFYLIYFFHCLLISLFYQKIYIDICI